MFVYLVFRGHEYHLRNQTWQTRQNSERKKKDGDRNTHLTFTCIKEVTNLKLFVLIIFVSIWSYLMISKKISFDVNQTSRRKLTKIMLLTKFFIVSYLTYDVKKPKRKISQRVCRSFSYTIMNLESLACHIFEKSKHQILNEWSVLLTYFANGIKSF